jgi:hypothetical protein
MGKGGVASFRDLIDTIYEDVFAYTTVKVVKTKDWRLSVMKRMFNAGVGVYIFFFVVFFHGYLFKEVPVVTVSTSVSADSLGVALRNLSVVYSNGGYPPYCSASRVNGTSSTVTDYVWGPGRTYVNNECARYFTAPEFTEKVYMGVWLHTYWQQANYKRVCQPNNYTGTSSAPSNGVPVPPAMVGNPSNVPNCGTAALVVNQSVIPVAAESVTLTVAGTYITTWGRTRTQMNTTISGAASTGINASLHFEPNQLVQFKFSDLLALAGIDLDAENVLNDGGAGPPWPTYRITGVEVVMEMQYRNYVETYAPPDPFNSNDYLIAQVYPASRGTFRSPGTKLWYLGPDISQPETHFMARTPHGVLLTFRPSGSIGTPTFGALISTLVGAAVLFGFATTLVDVSAAFLIEGFREQKFEDELELRIRAMLRTQLADVPTRAEIDAYEQETLMAHLKAEGQAAKQKARLDRMRSRAQKQITKAARDGMAAAGAGAGAGAGAHNAPVHNVGGGGGGGGDDGGGGAAGGGAGGNAPPGALAGVTRSLAPRVVRLVVSGENYHSGSFIAQGFLENCRCVRFQWYRSRDGRNFVPIPGATLPTFYASADDVAHILAVDATPVTDDGFEGAPRRALTGVLSTQPHILGRVHEMKNTAAGGWTDVKDGVWVSGLRATIRLMRDTISCRTKASVELGTVAVPGIEAVLSRTDPCAMALTGTDGMVFDITFRTPEERDIVALVVRELAGASIELLNDPAYMPAPPQDSGEDEDEE